MKGVLSMTEPLSYISIITYRSIVRETGVSTTPLLLHLIYDIHDLFT